MKVYVVTNIPANVQDEISVCGVFSTEHKAFECTRLAGADLLRRNLAEYELDEYLRGEEAKP